MVLPADSLNSFFTPQKNLLYDFDIKYLMAMINRNLIGVLLFLVSAGIYAQSIYVPLEFQEAYENGTRLLDGKPGAEYWQNHSDYKISVKLDPLKGIISGSAAITYFNSSPDTLDRLVFRMYQNINRRDAMRDYQVKNLPDNEGIIIQSLQIGKKNYDVKTDTNIENTGTNLLIKNQNINPGKQVSINVNWEFKIPKEEGVRMGQYDSAVFFIAYWYPQIAVYDDIDGWDLTEYTGNTEFYNDFNNYDVTITLPNNYGVWATGDLQNGDDIYAPKVLQKYSESLNSITTVNIITAQDYLDNIALYNSSSEKNSWHFLAKGVPDFSFGASANYLWDGRTSDAGGKKVFVSAVYDQASLTFYESCDIAAKTVEMLSKDLPGVQFPFPKITVFNGSGGMESPMMVNMSAEEKRVWQVHTVVHEVTHSYFPFYMGINERKYAWMDEGLTQMLSEYIQYEIDKTIDFRARNVKRYLDYSGQFDEVPMMYPSYMIRGEMYGNHAYFRPANAYNIMKDFMGDAEFKKALQEYMKRWNGKHPTPFDFFFTFEDATDDDLDWFYTPWFYEHGYPDVGIDTAYVKDDNLRIQIIKDGVLPIPVAITVRFKDGSVKRAYRTATAWKNEEDEQIWIEMEIDKKPASIELGNMYIPDVDTVNNYWLFK
ncbi:MAG: M1 family metallopeptidase [Ignavibacteria bacterium]